MKTTLKRGMGRGAAVNGNGRAVYPPAVAPPMRRYRQPPPAERSFARVVGKVFLWVVVLALMGAGGVAGGTYLFALPGSPGACKDAWDGILAAQLDYRHRPCNFVEIMPRLDEHLRRGAQ